MARSWLGLALGIVPAVLVGGAAGLVVARAVADPEAHAAAAFDPAGRQRIQQQLTELVLRGAGVSSRTDPVVIDASDLNAFLREHVESPRLPLQPLVVRPVLGELRVSGRTSLGRILADAGAGGLASWLPARAVGIDLWVTAAGPLVVRGHEAEFVVETAAVGRQRVPPAVLWRLLAVDPRALLVWRLPRVVTRIETDPGACSSIPAGRAVRDAGAPVGWGG